MSRITPATLRYLRSTIIRTPSIFDSAARQSQNLRCSCSASRSHSPQSLSSHTRRLSTIAPRHQDAAPQSSTSSASQDTTPQDNTKSQATAPQPPKSHYDFFPRTLPQGPPPSGPFTIDPRALRNEFLRLQASAHPDRHAGARDKRRAEALSARINEAYKTLQSPLLRAQYLLSEQGRDVANDEHARVEDPGLLMQVLEAREEIEEAEEEGELVGLREENERRVEESVRALERAFAEGNTEAAVREAVKLRYWVNIRESIDGWERGKPVVLVH